VLYPLCAESQQMHEDEWPTNFLNMFCFHVYALHDLLKFAYFQYYESQETKNTSFNAYVNL